MIYTYEQIVDKMITIYIERDAHSGTFYASVRDNANNTCILTEASENADYVRFNEFLKYKIIVGFNIKGAHGNLNVLLNIMRGTPFDDIDHNVYNTFTYIDIAEFTKSHMLVGASIGMDINLEGGREYSAEVNHNILAKCVELYETDISVKLQFQESDGYSLEKCLKTKTTSLTASAIWNGDKEPLPDEKFAPKADLLEYFKLMLPLSLVTFYTTYMYNEIQEMSKLKEWTSFFHHMIADNLTKWGMGGAHSIHKKFNIFDKRLERWAGWTLLHIDGDGYYPNLMIKLMTISRRMNFNKFKEYILNRKRLKSDPNSNPKEVHQLKIKVNAMYGLMGSILNKLFDPTKQFDTVAHGQMIIVALAQQLYNIGGIVFQTNTDGLYVAIPTHLIPLVNKIREHLTKLTGITYDQVEVDILYQKNVNNYIKVYTDGKNEVKGAELCGDYKNDNIKSKQFPIVHKAVYDYLINGIPVAETIKACKDLSWFISCTFIGKGLSIRLVEYNSVTYKSGHHDGRRVVNRVNKQSSNLDVLKELYKFAGDVVRIVPCVPDDDKVTSIVIEQNTGAWKRESYKSTGYNPHVLLGSLDKYNFDDFNIDYDLLIELANERINDVLEYEQDYDTPARRKERELYGCK